MPCIIEKTFDFAIRIDFKNRFSDGFYEFFAQKEFLFVISLSFFYTSWQFHAV
jgi:hypothetical protein